MNSNQWRASPVLGVRNVRQAAEYYRDVLGFSLDPVDGVFEPTADEPGGVYAIVKRSGVWIHFQIRRGELPQRTRQAFEGDVYLYVDDLDGLFADLQKRGAVIREPPRGALRHSRDPGRGSQWLSPHVWRDYPVAAYFWGERSLRDENSRRQWPVQPEFFLRPRIETHG